MEVRLRRARNVFWGRGLGRRRRGWAGTGWGSTYLPRGIGVAECKIGGLIVAVCGVGKRGHIELVEMGNGYVAGLAGLGLHRYRYGF